MSDTITNLRSPATNSPFDLSDEQAYQCWREWKLTDYPGSAEDLIVSVANPGRLSPVEKHALLSRCQKANAAIYRFSSGDFADKNLVGALGRQFGLARLDRNLRADEDSITSLKVVSGSGGAYYIPYTNRPLNWHTDGYYNTPGEQVRGVVLHCVSDAAEGGENVYLDHEIAYLLLRDEHPDYLAALMQPDAMTIPANTEAADRCICAIRRVPAASPGKTIAIPAWQSGFWLNCLPANRNSCSDTACNRGRA